MLDLMQTVHALFICVLGLTACQNGEHTVQEQVAQRHGALRPTSLEPWKGTRVGEEASFDYLLHRTAIQWDKSVELELRPSLTEQAGETWVGVAADGSETRQVGSSVAIDADGYFLTAGHCVESGQCLLLCDRGDLPPIEILGTVIWNGLVSAKPVAPDESRDCDLAVVYAPSGREMSLRCMPWSSGTSPRKGTHVLVGGAGATTVRLAGGRVTESASCVFVTEEKATDASVVSTQLQMQVIRCDAPLVPGDSGGPAMLQDGTLVGIAVATSADGPPVSTLLRPDLGWLGDLIDRHRESLRGIDVPRSEARPSALGWMRLQQQRAELEAAVRD